MITLVRYYSKEATLGILKVDGLDVPIYTLELPDKNNEPNISCIPIGKYIVKPHISPSKGKCFIIEGAVGRTYILIHSGNLVSDIKGCVLVGLETGYLKSEKAVKKSRDAMKILKEHIKEPTELRIKNLYV